MERQILFIDVVHENLEKGLAQYGWKCADGTNWNKDEISASIAGFTGVVIRSRFRLDESLLSKATKLKFIARSGAGMENIDVDYCNSKGIQLFNAPEGNRQAVGEHALGMLLSLTNKLIQANTQVKKGIWDREGNRGVELSERTVGLIGYGNNGSAFAKVLSGLGCKTIAYDKYKKDFSDDFAQEVSLEEIYAFSDVLSFHVPQTSETTFMFNRSFLEKMKKPFYLLNLSRGKVVETTAVKEGLEKGKILGAGLDVLEFEKSSFQDLFSDIERLPESLAYLLKSDKVILTPHVGGWTTASYRKLSDVLLNKIISVDRKGGFS